MAHTNNNYSACSAIGLPAKYFYRYFYNFSFIKNPKSHKHIYLLILKIGLQNDGSKSKFNYLN